MPTAAVWAGTVAEGNGEFSAEPPIPTSVVGYASAVPLELESALPILVDAIESALPIP
jgi:hypothetical protein